MPLLGVATSLFGAEKPRRKRLGVCSYSYNIHWKAARDGHPQVRFKDTIEFLEYCRQLGAGVLELVGYGGAREGIESRVPVRVETLRRPPQRQKPPLQQVLVVPPPPGDYAIRVVAANTPFPPQGYALCVVGELATPLTATA